MGFLRFLASLALYLQKSMGVEGRDKHDQSG